MDNPAIVFRRRLLALISFLVVSIAVCMIAALIITTEARRTIGRLATVEVESSRLARQFRSEVDAVYSILLRIGSEAPDDSALAIQHHRERLRLWLLERDSDPAPAVRRVLNTLRSELAEYFDKLNALVSQSAGFTTRLDRAQITELNDRSMRLQRLADDFDAIHDAEERQLVTDAFATVASQRNLTYLCLVLVIASTAVMGFMLYRDLVRPVRAQLVQAEETLSKRQKLAALGTLAAGVAHEIRNPLTAIKARLFTLRKTLAAPTAVEDAQAIDAEIDRLERIVRDVLGYARPAEPKLVLIELAAWLRNAAAFIEPELADHGIELAVHAAAAVQVMADGSQLRQVIFNLSRNSEEALAGKPGRITLAVRCEPASLRGKQIETAVLEVADDGPGIPPEIQTRLFEPFFTSKPAGTGLGLSTVASIVEAHGGEISFQTAPGAGTRFLLRLPAIHSGPVHTLT